jgi:hypothetical protein
VNSLVWTCPWPTDPRAASGEEEETARSVSSASEKQGQEGKGEKKGRTTEGVRRDTSGVAVNVGASRDVSAGERRTGHGGDAVLVVVMTERSVARRDVSRA